MPGEWPAETVMTVTLEDRGSRTAMTVREEGHPPRRWRRSPSLGLRQSIDKLADYLEAAEETPTGPPE